jgi:hypothetical protein
MTTLLLATKPLQLHIALQLQQLHEEVQSPPVVEVVQALDPWHLSLEVWNTSLVNIAEMP